LKALGGKFLKFAKLPRMEQGGIKGFNRLVVGHYKPIKKEGFSRNKDFFNQNKLGKRGLGGNIFG